jgi:hypothetical protein
MTRPFFILILSLLMALLIQTSCEDRSVTPSETHWDAVKAIVSEYPEVFRLGFYDSEADSPFYRQVTSNNPDIEEGILKDADSTHLFSYITLTWGDSLKGEFVYRFDGQTRTKPISSVTLTNAYFEKWGEDYDPHRGWLLRQFSGTVISSTGDPKRIYTVEISSEGVYMILSEPLLLKLAKKDSILAFGMGKQVTLTIDVPDTSDFFFLHVKETGTYQKISFTNNGDGTLSASWTTTTDPELAEGYKHAIVDAVSKESVTDTLSDYQSTAWGIVYKLE